MEARAQHRRGWPARVAARGQPARFWEQARARVQGKRFDQNWAWFKSQIPALYEANRGKMLCIAGSEVFCADTVEEAVNSFEDWPQTFRELEIEVEFLLFGMNFKDHREHRRRLRLPKLVP